MKLPRPLLRLLALPAALSVLTPPGALARNIFVMPVGTGHQDGSSWEHALGQEALSSGIFDTLKPGDHLKIGSGHYQGMEASLTQSGTAQAPIVIEGVDRNGKGLPEFRSAWQVTQPDRGATAFTLAAGVSHVTLQNLKLKGYQVGILAGLVKNEAESRRHLKFSGLAMSHVRHGCYLSFCEDLIVEDCDIRRYTKHAYRFEEGCDRVQLRQCVADCSERDPDWEKRTELLPFGFLLNGKGQPNTGFTFSDCLAANHLMPLQKAAYKNGDGFVVEGNARDIRFIRCRALRNQDGGYDLKARDVVLTDCIALHNGRNIRIWATATLTNCLMAGGHTGLWNNGGPIMAERCTFFHLSGPAILCDDAAHKPVILKNCLLGQVEEVSQAHEDALISLDEGSVLATSDSGEPLDLSVATLKSWQGLDARMNSRKHPGKGYQWQH